MVRSVFHFLSRPRDRARFVAWVGMLSMVFLLGLGGFGGLPLPANGTEVLGVGGPLVVCSATGFTILNPDESASGIHDPGLCLMCLPLMGMSSSAVAVLLLLVFMVWGLVPVRLRLTPLLSVARLLPRTFFVALGPRGPPGLI